MTTPAHWTSNAPTIRTAGNTGASGFDARCHLGYSSGGSAPGPSASGRRSRLYRTTGIPVTGAAGGERGSSSGTRAHASGAPTR